MAGRDVETPDTSRIPRPDIRALVFIPGSVGDGELERMFGDIKDEGDVANKETLSISCDNNEQEDENKHYLSSDFVGSIFRESNIKVTTITSFKLSISGGIHIITRAKPELCWFKFQGRNSIKMVNRSGKIEKMINLGTRARGFTVTSDDKLIFCCTTQECIKEMELPDGDIFEKIDTSPLTPNYVCTGPSGHIYVTLYDEDDYDVTEDSTRVLIRYDRWRKENGRCKRNQFAKNIFVVPEEVSVNKDETKVAVINRICERRRELVLLDKDLSPVSIYTGPSVLTGVSLARYDIRGALFDTQDNILVAEYYSKTVQLLSPSCEPLKILLSIDTSPCALTVNDDEVWLGDSDGNVRIFRYSF
ncbi:uncharacterized protein LOC132558411 [Ylistrum balloti]|uniref:uncharacterized protein LOC132558411 n=1 Tax=Ylistrum balloti TaxID=509963 RepID=UPI002905E1D3|nr:uncharacterized protein LOC132558411 [Ylistrum balloti]